MIGNRKILEGSALRRFKVGMAAVFLCTAYLAFPSLGSAISVPMGANAVAPYEPIAEPVRASSPLTARPIALGQAAQGGMTLGLYVAMEDFDGAVDAYLAVYAPPMDPLNFYLFTAGGLQPLTSGAVPWLAAVTQIDMVPLTELPLTLLPAGIYTFYLMVVPAGTAWSAVGDNFYFWQTALTVTTANGPQGIPVQDIVLPANQVTELRFTYDFPSSLPPVTAITVDAQATWASLAITPLVQAAARQTLVSEQDTQFTSTITVRIGAASEFDSVCQTGVLYGPFEGRGSQVTPQTVTVRQATLRVINLGSISVCVQVIPSEDVQASMQDLAYSKETCDESPVSIGGPWSGTYTCINHPCENIVDQPVSLTIAQDGHSATYTDSFGAQYAGTVCGNVFRFNSTNDDFIGANESGEFVLNADGSATKTSSWISGGCSGSCEDHLVRVQ